MSQTDTPEVTALKRAKRLQNLTNAGKGRAPGVPNKATVEVKETCAKLVDDPLYRRNLRRRLIAGELAPAVECMLFYYAKGKPKESVVVDGSVSFSWTLRDDPTQD